MTDLEDDAPDTPPAWLWFVVLTFSVALGLLLVLTEARSSPAPAPKPKPVASTTPDVVGRWMMTWGAGKGPADFNADGSYWCFWGGQTWNGRWAQDGSNLTVEEWLVGGTGRPITWAATINGSRSGTLLSGEKFALEKP